MGSKMRDLFGEDSSPSGDLVGIGCDRSRVVKSEMSAEGAFMRVVSILLALIAFCVRSSSAQVVPFVEFDDGRAPITNAMDTAGQSIDIYLFRLTDDPIIASLVSAPGRGVTVRALLEPCPGDTGCNPPLQEAINACVALQQGGAQVKWANQAYVKTHAKTIMIDGRLALEVRRASR